MIIAIEGMDGVGKTTIANEVAKIINFSVIDHPLKKLIYSTQDASVLANIEIEVCKSSNKVFTSWFYGLSNIFLCEAYREQNIIIDRHILSNFCWSGAEDSEFVFDAINKAIGNPAYTVLLYATPERILERMQKRDPNDKDLKKIAYIDCGYSKMKYIMQKYIMTGTVINTSNLSINEVVQIIIEKLKENNIV